MGQVIGFLNKVTEKPTSNGGTIYSIQCEVDGNNEWFGFGFDAPHFGVDSEIEFDVEARGDYENVINDTLVVLVMQNEPAAAPPKPKRGARGGAKPARQSSRAAAPARTPRGGAKPAAPAERKPRGATKPAADKPAVDWDRKDRLIRAQSCQNTAVATISLLNAAGALALPKKKGEQYDALQALIEKESQRLFLKYDEVADECYDYDGAGAAGGGDDPEYDDGDGIPE